MRHFEHPKYEWLNQRLHPILHEALHNSDDPEEYLSRLPLIDQCAFYLGVLMWQVGNGGIHEYLCGTYAHHSERAVQFLHAVGATDVGDALNRLRDYLPSSYFTSDREERENYILRLCNDRDVGSLDDLVSVDIDLIDLDGVYSYCTDTNNSG